MCDDVVGQVVKKLEELGIAEDTIVVYTSDNGCPPWRILRSLLHLVIIPAIYSEGTRQTFMKAIGNPPPKEVGDC